MIVEDQDVPDCLAPWRDMSRLDREDSLLASRRRVPPVLGSNYHRLFLKRWRIDISKRKISFEHAERTWPSS
jgi:hypothetical protein